MTQAPVPTVPDPTAPPETIGSQPRNASEVNGLVGLHLKAFMAAKASVNQDAAFMTATDLKVAPYYFTADQETALKSAVNSLDTALDGIDLTFVIRVIGMW